MDQKIDWEAGAAVIVVAEASAPKVYPRVTLARASTLSGSVVRTLRGAEGLSKMFCLVASSLGPCSAAPPCKGDVGGCRGAEEIGVGFQQRSVAGSQARKGDRVRSVVSGHAIFGPGEPAIYLRCPHIYRWWI